MYSSAPRSISLGRSLAATAAVIGALGIMPERSQAATVSLTPDGLRFTAAAGEVNDVSLERFTGAAGGEVTTTVFRYTDRVPVTAGVGCRSVDAFTATCFGSNGRHIISLGDRDDHLTLLTLDDSRGVVQPTQISGGLGDDIIIGGNASDDTISGDDGRDRLAGLGGDDVLRGLAGNDRLTPGQGSDDISGGDGADTANYGDHSLPVRITLDGIRNDGEDGEADNVRENVERLQGGTAGDVLIGNDAFNAFEPSPGDDQYSGRGGNDVWLAGTDAGRDSFAGEEGTADRVDYSASTAPVRVTLDSLSDDGRANESDLVGFGVENVVGSEHADTIIGNFAANTLFGHVGDDVIDGGGGSDTIDGFGFIGLASGESDNDTIRALDGRADTVECSVGIDSVTADTIDSLSNCETIIR